MRTLMVKQKKFLDKIVKENKNITSWEHLNLAEIETLEKMNDTEILYQEVNRYLEDKATERRYNNKTW